jgi:hypothetical protein
MLMNHFVRLFSVVRGRRRPPHTDSDQAFYAKLECQFVEVHERQRQRTAGLWRATDECPTTFRIQAGDLSHDELRHIKSCHLCWLIYDLTRFDRLLGSIRLRTRRTIRWVAESPAAPVAFGLVVILALMFLRVHAVRREGLIRDTVPPSLSSESAVQVRSNASSPKIVPEQAIRRDLDLSKLPPEIELQQRLGPRFAREFEPLRHAASVLVSPDSELGHRLLSAWLATLRTAGNGLFLEIVRDQIALAPKVQSEAFVELAELHADLVKVTGRKYLLALLQVQAKIASRTMREQSRTHVTSLVGERVLREATAQRDAASPHSLGQAGALRAARMRLDVASTIALR